MIGSLKMGDEIGRIKALERYEILDTPEEESFDGIVQLIQQVIKAPMVLVSLVDNDRQWFKAKRGVDVCHTARGISFCTVAIQSPEPFIVRDALNDPRFNTSPLVLESPYVRSYAGIPLRTPDGYNVGSLCVMDTVTRDFNDFEISILANFAKLVIDGLELRRIASSDQLTGSLTRRAWLERASQEIGCSQKYRRDIAVGILDIDHFKAVNDTHGHPAGDRVIRSIAQDCMESLRDCDLLGRIGGEEFAILMPNAEESLSLLFAEQLRSRIEQHSIDVGTPIKVTASIGLTNIRHSEDTIEAMIERADKALYEAKRSGRNRVVTSGAHEADAAMRMSA